MGESERGYHEFANLFPMMDKKSFDLLVLDIGENGQRESIKVDKTGLIVDGRNRYKACLKLGISPLIEVVYNVSVEYVMSLNYHRRHLTKSQRAAVAVSYLPILEREAKKRMLAGKALDPVALVPQGLNGKARDQAAAIFDVGSRYISDAKKIKEAAPDLFDDVKRGDVPIKIAIRELKSRDRARKREREKKLRLENAPPNKFELYHSSCIDMIDRVDSGSIDAIVTDPPYPREYLHTFDELAQLAEHCLKPNGICIIMSGQSYLPEIYKMLGRYLTYRWTGAYLAFGKHTQVWKANVNTMWKPILIYDKGGDREWIHDVTKSKAPDKDFHTWGQSTDGLIDLVRTYTSEGMTILDPFVGGGSTAEASLSLGRFFIGSDIDANEVEKTRSRVSGKH